MQAVLFPSFPDLKWKFHSWVGCNAPGLWGVGEQRTHESVTRVEGPGERNVRAGLLRAECPPAVALSLQPCAPLPPALPSQASDVFRKSRPANQGSGKSPEVALATGQIIGQGRVNQSLFLHTSCLPIPGESVMANLTVEVLILGMHRVRCGSLTMDFALLPPLEGCGSGVCI